MKEEEALGTEAGAQHREGCLLSEREGTLSLTREEREAHGADHLEEGKETHGTVRV